MHTYAPSSSQSTCAIIERHNVGNLGFQDPGLGVGASSLHLAVNRAARQSDMQAWQGPLLMDALTPQRIIAHIRALQ